ncbi:MAG TPA: hypothetical protein VFQ45_03535 [Longimicrobium sp.]|nr:hypothetical protein [Longimicrobium sp.]
MRKLRLDLDSLAVESFATGNAGVADGTVLARQVGIGEPGDDRSARPTSWRSCAGDCFFQLSQYEIRQTCVGDCFGWMESQIFTCQTREERICRGPDVTPTRLDD